MKAVLLRNDRSYLADNAYVRIKVWQAPRPVPGSAHGYKYSLAYVVDETCVLRYDNEAGKGDHKHVRGVEVAYAFTTLDALVDDFFNDIGNL